MDNVQEVNYFNNHKPLHFWSNAVCYRLKILIFYPAFKNIKTLQAFKNMPILWNNYKCHAMQFTLKLFIGTKQVHR
jgi:hypothetical protein